MFSALSRFQQTFWAPVIEESERLRGLAQETQKKTNKKPRRQQRHHQVSSPLSSSSASRSPNIPASANPIENSNNNNIAENRNTEDETRIHVNNNYPFINLSTGTTIQQQHVPFLKLSPIIDIDSIRWESRLPANNITIANPLATVNDNTILNLNSNDSHTSPHLHSRGEAQLGIPGISSNVLGKSFEDEREWTLSLKLNSGKHQPMYVKTMLNVYETCRTTSEGTLIEFKPFDPANTTCFQSEYPISSEPIPVHIPLTLKTKNLLVHERSDNQQVTPVDRATVTNSAANETISPSDEEERESIPLEVIRVHRQLRDQERLDQFRREQPPHLKDKSFACVVVLQSNPSNQTSFSIDTSNTLVLYFRLQSKAPTSPSLPPTSTIFSPLPSTISSSLEMVLTKQKAFIHGKSYILKDIYGIECILYSNQTRCNQNNNINFETASISVQECSICLTNPKNTILIPCGHLCICKSCAKRLVSTQRQQPNDMNLGLDIQSQSKDCPICRQEMRRALKVTIIEIL